MERWLSTLEELLVKPFVVDNQGRPEPHHVDLRESQFWDWETREDDFDRALAAFEADRARMARALSLRYGAPERRYIRPYFDGDGSPNDPGSSLFEYLTGWFFEIDLWQAGTRGIVAEVGHYDKELPLQLMLVVGDLGTHGLIKP
ncbi:hypothetical protein V6V47_32350 [Micromonospora sp. CPCC 205539]|uniref:hypothetical protein n=1 Tax=Micromonospora sp. CPCC 205539 TaxID=3122408 RepID=UPI002FF15ABB